MVSVKKHFVLVNCHELVLCSDSFEKLLLLDQRPQVEKAPKKSKGSKSPVVSGPTPVLGRPFLVSKFPEIITTAASFIKAHA